MTPEEHLESFAKTARDIPDYCRLPLLEFALEMRTLRESLQKTRGALADIHTSADMTLRLARKKAGRTYIETGPNVLSGADLPECTPPQR